MAFFQEPIERLQQQGFCWIGVLDIRPLIYQEGRQRDPQKKGKHQWEILLFHPEQKVYAHIGLRNPAKLEAGYQVAFYTFFEDRSLLITLNGQAHRLIGSLPNTTVQDFYTPHLQEQWLGHCQAIGQKNVQSSRVDEAMGASLTPKRAIKVPYLVYADVLNAHYRDYLQALWDCEAIVPMAPQAGQPQLQRLSWKMACRTAWKMQRGQRRAKQFTRQIQEAQLSMAKDIPNAGFILSAECTPNRGLDAQLDSGQQQSLDHSLDPEPIHSV